MSDSVDRVFVHALNTVKRIPRTGSARPPPSDRLKLYGLYKQSMEGDVEGVMSRPEGDDIEATAEKEKWDAWSSQHGISRTEAKRRYISTLIETMHKYAFTTPEARELVAELEFVWDQIKSNSVSSTTSSPDRPLDFPVSSSRVRSSRPYPSYASIGPGRAQISENDLEALRPASDSNAESEDGVDNFEEDRDRQRPPNDALPPYPAHNVGSREREYEIRNRKWRKRIEQTLIKITTELAALREQIEAKSGHGSLGAGHRRRGLLAWLLSLVVVAARHLVVDALVLGAVLFWMRGDERVRSVVGILVTVLRERIQRMGLLRLDLRGRGD